MYVDLVLYLSPIWGRGEAVGGRGRCIIVSPKMTTESLNGINLILKHVYTYMDI